MGEVPSNDPFQLFVSYARLGEKHKSRLLKRSRHIVTTG